MKKISDATKIMEGILGLEPSKYFDGQAEELVWYAKSLSMDPSKAGKSATPDHIKVKFEKISHSIITMSVKSFIAEKYGESSSIIVTDDFKVLDKNMKPIVEVSMIRKRQEEITAILVSVAMSEFSKGRKIADEIVDRVKGHMATTPVKSRNYSTDPPIEAIEIELIRLENKLPFLSHIEGKRLSELYEKVRNSIELDGELASSEQ